MRRTLAMIFAVMLFSSLFAVFGTSSALAARLAEDAGSASTQAAAASAGFSDKVLRAAPVGQRHIVLLRPIAPRSMPISVVDAMKERVLRDFRVPLNETLRAVRYADDAEIEQAMRIIYGGEGSLAERLKRAAEETDADYIAGFAVTEYRETTYRNWKDELVLHSSVNLRLLGYDRARDLVVDLPASRSYHSEYSPSGTARILVLFEIDRLMDKADFRSTLFPITDWLDKPRKKIGGAA